MPRIKISGITNTDDAKWAAILGVEFVSVSFREGDDKRASYRKAQEIRSVLPSYTGFVIEVDESVPSERWLEKMRPDYIQTDTVNRRHEQIPGVILETDLEATEDYVGSSESVLFQIMLGEDIPDGYLETVKDKLDMERTIVHGDWDLARIKRACEILQPFAWSVRDKIEKSPRKIDYRIMKEYIREISLW